MYSLIHMPVLSIHAEQKLSAVNVELWPAVRNDIVSKRAQLFQCPDDSYLVLRIDGNELVIVACVGSNGIAMMQRCIEIAFVNSCTSVRFHTQRRGMSRLLKRFNPVELERVYKVDV